MERTRREESLSFKEKMGRLLADAPVPGNGSWNIVIFSGISDQKS